MDTPREDAAVAAPDWRAALPAILAVFVVSRVLLVLVVMLVEATIPLGYERPTYSTLPIIGGLTGHDAIYFLGIAAEGYHLEPVAGPYHDWVFFPLFPLLTRAAAVLTLGDVAVAGVLVANAALLVSLVLVYLIARPHSGHETAMLTVVLVAFAPGAVAFGMAYSDSLLLATAAGAMLAASGRRYVLMGMLFAAATLARPPGILIGLPLLAALVAADGRRPRVGWLMLGAGPLALGAFAAYQGLTLGDPLAFVRGQPAWNIPPAAGPDASGDGFGSVAPLVLILVTTLLAYTAMLPRLVRGSIPAAHVLVAIVAFASVFVSGRLQSDARYLALGWPFAWLLASSLPPSRRAMVVAALGGVYVLMAFLHITQALAP